MIIIKPIILLTFLLVLAFIILNLYILKNHKIISKKNNEIKILETNLANSLSSFDKLNSELEMVSKLYNASKILIHYDKESKLYERITENIKNIFNAKCVVLYVLNVETRVFEIKSWFPKTEKFINKFNFKDHLSNTYSKNEISYMLKDSQQKELGYIRIFQKQVKINNIYEESNFTQNDLSIFDIYINQVCLVIEKIKTYKVMERMALTDELTSLYNRHYAEMRLLAEVKRANRECYDISILFMDIDKFKRVNDTYGHDVGDLALKLVSKIVKDNAREYDVAVRWGGEEFVMILPNTTTKGAYILAERLRQYIENSNFKYCNLTISIGISTYPKDSVSIENIIGNADSALYYSKEHGRNRTTVYSQKNRIN